VPSSVRPVRPAAPHLSSGSFSYHRARHRTSPLTDADSALWTETIKGLSKNVPRAHRPWSSALARDCSCCSRLAAQPIEYTVTKGEYMHAHRRYWMLPRPMPVASSCQGPVIVAEPGGAHLWTVQAVGAALRPERSVLAVEGVALSLPPASCAQTSPWYCRQIELAPHARVCKGVLRGKRPQDATGGRGGNGTPDNRCALTKRTCPSII
jgi:hypothetical protein